MSESTAVYSHEPRVMGGCSLHESYDPEKCPKTSHAPKVRGERCGFARCVDCCRQQDDMDVDECSKCGRQRMVTCYFDEECS